MGIILKFSFNHKNIATCLFIKKINEPFLLKQPLEKRFVNFICLLADKLQSKMFVCKKI